MQSKHWPIGSTRYWAHACSHSSCCADRPKNGMGASCTRRMRNGLCGPIVEGYAHVGLARRYGDWTLSSTLTGRPMLWKKVPERMGIQKQEFYEGAALHQLVRGSAGVRISYAPPFFVVDDRLQLHLKYSARARSPWGFSFPPDEQLLMDARAAAMPLVIGLICGSDGIAALPYEKFRSTTSLSPTAVWISCSRLHREHFEVRGPDAMVAGKIPPSDWSRLTRKQPYSNSRNIYEAS